MHAIFRSPKIFFPNSKRLFKRGCHCEEIYFDSYSMRLNKAIVHRHLSSSRWLMSTDRRNTFESAFNTSSVIPSSSAFCRNHNWVSPSTTFILVRNFSTTTPWFDKDGVLKPSSKVEVTVQNLKDEKKAKDAAQIAPLKPAPPAPIKKSIKQKIVDELTHYYHGFRLLFIDINVSRKLIWRILNGKTLNRREHRLLVRTTADMFRLLPFSVFIIVPFMELLLPVVIKLFPGMLPSTFQTATEKEDKLKQSLKVKLEMAKFLTQTLDDMAVQHKDHKSQLAKEFSEWFVKIRQSGVQASNEEIMKFSKLFEDEITLDSLGRPQLTALCRVLEVNTIGTNNFLRFQLRMKLRSLAADDKMIQREGVNTMTLSEVQQACRSRGMRAYGMPESRLRSQLNDWINLSLNEKVPPSLLLLSRALMLPENVPTSDKLKATISTLPETIVTQTKAAIGEREGKIDNKTKIELIKEEERKIKEERQEAKEEEKRKELETKEALVDKAPIISARETAHLPDTAIIINATLQPTKPEPKKPAEFTAKDLEVVEDALDTLSKSKKTLVIEKEVIKDIKEEIADYQEDVKEFKEIMVAADSSKKGELKETKGAQRLLKKVNKMITKMDNVVQELESKEVKKADPQTVIDHKDPKVKKEESIQIQELMMAIKKVKNVPDESRLKLIETILSKIDSDSDGRVKVEDVLKVIEIISKEDGKMSTKQLDELVQVLNKEEVIEKEEKKEKEEQALAKSKIEDKAIKEATEMNSKSKKSVS